jgi:hypothetical protein
MVERGIARARAHGMTWEKNLAKFVALMFLTAPNFDSHPLIHHILRDKQVDPESRLDRLWENISSENWSAVRQQYDISAWQLNAEER